MQNLLSEEFKISLEHGGSLVKGKRKISRPISTNKPLHLVFRSDIAVGSLSLLKHEALVREILTAEAERNFVKIYNVAICGNHLHLCVKAETRDGLKTFLRLFSGRVAKKILFLTKSHLKKFWSYSVYSRIVGWGKPYQVVMEYIHKNYLEAQGLIPYTPRNIRK